AKDLRGVRRNGVPDSPISVALPSSLPAVTRGSIPRRVGCHKSVDYDSKDGKPVWGVELRAARKAAKWIVSLINVNRHAVEIVLKGPVADGKGRDLIANKPIAADGPLVLEPRAPMLLELP
ncbi:MAG TPA: hypothetical protein VM487_23685, partial [Phycisphaerae bacterium]|nr:hypothetical protein [Phycisphaerae bacterium]